jgi:hypothetical protein
LNFALLIVGLEAAAVQLHPPYCSVVRIMQRLHVGCLRWHVDFKVAAGPTIAAASMPALAACLKPAQQQLHACHVIWLVCFSLVQLTAQSMAACGKA